MLFFQAFLHVTLNINIIDIYIDSERNLSVIVVCVVISGRKVEQKTAFVTIRVNLNNFLL